MAANFKGGEQSNAVHAGEAPDPSTGASAPNIVMSSTFVVDAPAGFSAHDLNEDSPYLYARWGNPNVKMLEDKIATLQGMEAGAGFASGMAAASAIFTTFLSAGDHCIVSDISYAGVAELVRDTLPRFGIEVSLANMSDPEAVAQAMRPNTRLVHTETPVNPITRLTDLAAVSRIAHGGGALVSCDATFQSPIGWDATRLGVDLVMHSATKYIGGHGDAVGGIVLARRALIKQMVTEATIHSGGVMSPFNAWLIARGAATLPLRMRAHQEGAMAVATWLEADPRVERVFYPGLPSHPQHGLAQRQMTNTSGMLAFQVGNRSDGDRIAAQMIERLQMVHYAVSLGHHRSLIFWMPTDDLLATSFRLDPQGEAAYRAFAGDGIFRLSIGLEDAEDIIADLDRALG